MLNENQERELAYVIRVNKVEPIAGRDRVESVIVNGWHIMCRKGVFKSGDLAIYFEIDSKLPEKEPFMFLKDKHFKIKTQKYKTPDGYFYSQGLLMSFADFGWDMNKYNEGDFLTKELGVTYAEAEDNKRKANIDKYKKMAQRRPKLFSKKPVRWLMKRTWGKKLMFFFFGKKKDKKGGWPQWVVKTDEERCQNLPNLFPGDDTEWIATEKIDGTSTTFTMKGFGRKRQFFVCSRNVVFDKPNKNCFYETNVYTEMAEKYDIEEKMAEMMSVAKSDLDFITIQGETYGAGIQKRDYSITDHNLMVFNVIFGFKDGRVERLNPIMMKTMMDIYSIPTVPIVDEHFKIPSTCDELLKIAGGASAVDGKPREGLVFRSIDGARSFKAVSPEFLLKFHS